MTGELELFSRKEYSVRIVEKLSTETLTLFVFSNIGCDELSVKFDVLCFDFRYLRLHPGAIPCLLCPWHVSRATRRSSRS